MFKIISIVILIIFLSSPAKADLFSISVPVFSADKPKKPKYSPGVRAHNGKIEKSSLASGHVWISFAIIGGPKALKVLNEDNELYVGVETKCGNSTSTKKISIGINQENWIDNQYFLENSFKENGFFTWRTRARTSRVNCERLTIRIYDGNGNVIGPPAHSELYEPVLQIAQNG